MGKRPRGHSAESLLLGTQCRHCLPRSRKRALRPPVSEQELSVTVVLSIRPPTLALSHRKGKNGFLLIHCLGGRHRGPAENQTPSCITALLSLNLVFQHLIWRAEAAALRCTTTLVRSLVSSVFSLPPHRPFDCCINLLPGAPFPSGRLYNLT